MNIRIKIFMLLFSLFLAPVSIWAIANILSFYTWGFQPISFFDTLAVIYQFVIEKKIIFHFPLYFSVTFFFPWFISVLVCVLLSYFMVDVFYSNNNNFFRWSRFLGVNSLWHSYARSRIMQYTKNSLFQKVRNAPF